MFSKYKMFLFKCLNHAGFFNSWPDDKYLKIIYKLRTNRELDLDNPKGFNEKLQWIKLHDRKPVYSTLVDKYRVKEYVGSIIGEEYIVPLLGVYDSFDDIDFNKLPNQFVLKCNHDSGGVVVCKDKTSFDKTSAKNKLTKHLKRKFYMYGREWPYKNVQPKIIAEQYLEDQKTGELRDYKFYTFGGVAKVLCINTNRGKPGGMKVDYFDMDGNNLNFTWGFLPSEKKPEFPKNFKKMVELAERLAKDTYEVRVDFYEVNGKIYFGEFTLLDGGGFVPIDPYEWDLKLGDMIDLPLKGKK